EAAPIEEQRDPRVGERLAVPAAARALVRAEVHDPIADERPDDRLVDLARRGAGLDPDLLCGREQVEVGFLECHAETLAELARIAVVTGGLRCTNESMTCADGRRSLSGVQPRL